MKTLLLFVLAVAAFGADISGKWTFNVETDAGSGTPSFVLEQKGEALTGKYSGQLGEAPVKGTVKGNAVEIIFEISGGTIIYQGTIESDSKMKGTCDLAGQAKGTFTAQKTK